MAGRLLLPGEEMSGEVVTARAARIDSGGRPRGVTRGSVRERTEAGASKGASLDAWIPSDSADR